MLELFRIHQRHASASVKIVNDEALPDSAPPTDVARRVLGRCCAMSSSSEPAAHRRPSPAAILLVPVVVALALTLFAWPSARLAPRDLPIGVAGAPAAAAAVEQRLAQREGAFEIKRYPDEAAARQAIEDREIYGAFVATPGEAKVLVASAASPVVAQTLTQAAAEGQAAPMPVEDVVPASPRAAALPSSVLPLLIAGIVTGVASSLLASGVAGRAALVVTGSVLAGLVATAIVQGWLDIVEGDWWANAAGLALTVAAIASVVAGLNALLGPPGIAIAALTMVLVGNPFSGIASAPELLPQPVGELGQLLPPGAGGNLLRSTGFFDGAAAGGHVGVLAAWVLAGLTLLFVATLRDRKRAASPQRGVTA